MTPEDYAAASRSHAIERSALAACSSWDSWCDATGRTREVTPWSLGHYVAERSEPPDALRPSTLSIYVAALVRTLTRAGEPDPRKHPFLVDVLEGIRRIHGTDTVQAPPLLSEDVRRACHAWDRDQSPHTRRDHAALLLAWHGALRAGELVALNCQDVARDELGAVLTLRRTKTTQTSAVHRPVPLASDATCCPVRVLDRWIASFDGWPVPDHAGDWPLFCDVRGNRYGTARMSARAVSRLAVRAADAAGLVDAHTYSGHSLRAGCATSLFQAHVDGLAIQAHLGHVSASTTRLYLRDRTHRSRPTAGLL